MNPNDKKNLLDLTRVLLPNNQVALKRVKQAIEQSTGEVRHEGFFEDCNWWVEDTTVDHFENGWAVLNMELRRNKVLIYLKQNQDFAEANVGIFHNALNTSPSTSGWNWTHTNKGSERWDWVKTDSWRGKGRRAILLEIQHRFVKPGKILVSMDYYISEICLIDADKFDEINRLAQGTPLEQIAKLEVS